MNQFKHYFIVLLIFTTLAARAQTEVFGTVTDAKTGEVLPFVNVYFSGTQNGITTDIKGFYELTSSASLDTLVVSYIGYVTERIPLKRGGINEVDVSLGQDVMTLNEVIVRPGENPAFRVMRKVIAKKEEYDPRNIDYYKVESYNKIEGYIDKMNKGLEERKIIQKIVAAVDSVQPLRNKKGQKMIPVFFSESISNVYNNTNPKHSKEEVINSNIKGIMVDDNSIAQQFVGSAFQEYNFYDNWMDLFGKQFVSPLADSWKMYYEYELTDSFKVADQIHYQIEFEPKNKQNLAFIGTMLIEKNSWALKNISANITENTNINYLSGLQIFQEMKYFPERNVLLPEKVDVKLDVDPILGVYPGMYAVFNLSYSDFVFDRPMPIAFYDIPVKVLPKPSNDNFWVEKRHQPLNESNQQIATMIDDIRDIGAVRAYEDLLYFAITGYFELGKFDIGPYPNIYTFNDVEGHRFQLGGRTNERLSSKWQFGGHLAYGTEDQKFKYNANIKYILSRAPWQTIELVHGYELNQLGLKDVSPEDNPFFYASSRFGTLIKPYYSETNKLSFSSDIRGGLSVKAGVKTEHFEPDFPFNYIPNEQDTGDLRNSFNTTAIKLGIRYAKGEKFLIDGNRKLVVGRNSWPVFSLDYELGLKDVLWGDLDYHQLTANITHFIPYNGIGIGKMDLEAGRMFSEVPYPMLKVHTGNQGIFFSNASFNLMNFYEFVSDSYVSVKYTHYFEGMILNHIPLMKKLNWRLVGIANVIYGGMSDANKSLAGEEYNSTDGFYTLEDKPYVEFGYGVENIFKVLRVDFYHRLTYLDNPSISKFGVKFNFQLIL
ncbi:CarboxypepD_reg-like domain-containing protein [Marivirga sericea]|uniref:CarboxypepD_reg-like domain-containing protein n=1 Tax=Marivirga sericea TaxID=1028 RepID=A0A1X7ICK3_9BACT|nr:DUF5686 and carboxypeptidase-like regulatory domain-containing protein [Marivirga sericea]SMG11879.1 CarboxypepD_reg-like domain-containing protein [Marivirga sericea]